MVILSRTDGEAFPVFKLTDLSEQEMSNSGWDAGFVPVGIVQWSTAVLLIGLLFPLCPALKVLVRKVFH